MRWQSSHRCVEPGVFHMLLWGRLFINASYSLHIRKCSWIRNSQLEIRSMKVRFLAVDMLLMPLVSWNDPHKLLQRFFWLKYLTVDLGLTCSFSSIEERSHFTCSFFLHNLLYIQICCWFRWRSLPRSPVIMELVIRGSMVICSILMKSSPGKLIISTVAMLGFMDLKQNPKPPPTKANVIVRASSRFFFNHMQHSRILKMQYSFSTLATCYVLCSY